MRSPRPRASRPAPSRPSSPCGASSPSRAFRRRPSTCPPMAAGVFGYLGYDMVREMEQLAPAKPDPIGVPDSIVLRPTLMVVFDSVRDEISVVTPVRPQDGISAAEAYACRGPTARRRRGRAGGSASSRWRGDAARSGRAIGRAALQHRSRALPRDGRGGQGLHPCGRHLPGGAVAALHRAVRSAALRALPRAAAR